jgi:hypothetical protein
MWPKTRLEKIREAIHMALAHNELDSAVMLALENRCERRVRLMHASLTGDAANN